MDEELMKNDKWKMMNGKSCLVFLIRKVHKQSKGGGHAPFLTASSLS